MQRCPASTCAIASQQWLQRVRRGAATGPRTLDEHRWHSLGSTSRSRVPVPSTVVRSTTRTAPIVDEEAEVYVGETFYDILGVPPSADRRTIKNAYLSVMRECHPDRTNEEANEFCALLNEIWETLSDPARRATYDALVGFSSDSINPFLDASYERDQVFVDERTCIGCRNCCNVCPSTFMIEDEYGRARVMRQAADTPEKQQEAIDTCPVSCIHWVTVPQLSLLEAAMARMERVAVWSMGMSGVGASQDVFTEASLAWQKRHSELRQRRAEMASARNAVSGAPAPSPWSAWWNNVTSFQGSSGGSFYDQAARARARADAKQRADSGWSSTSSDDDEGWGAQQPASDKDARRIAALAARAARASRTWKVCQEAAAAARRRSLQITALSSASSMDEGDV